MKKIILAFALALGICASASAENYQAAYVGYSGTTLTAGDDGSATLNGFQAGYLYGLSFTDNAALEFGGNLGYVSKSEEGVTWKQFNIKVPVNLTYKFNIVESVAFAPYIGINFRFNPMHKISVGDFDDDFDFDVSTSEGLKKFQMGWQIGAKVYFSRFFVYGEFGTDFIRPVDADIYGKMNDRNFSVGIGYKF